MISILLPTYRYDVRPLVRALHTQASRLSVDWEILVMDDGSGGHWPGLHEELNALPGVRIRALEKNTGRAAIRNTLARAARFEHLLFLDGDSGLIRADFLASYVGLLPFHGVLYGGRTYALSPPADPALLLHWRYGHARESLPVAARRRRPYHAFMTNNFCIARATFLAQPFDEELHAYGHEDTLFGWQLRQRQVPIHHLDNPVEHLGLEPAAPWLAKQEAAIRNLHQLYHRYPYLHTRALGFWLRLRRWRLLPFAGPALTALAPLARRRLLSQKDASFYWLDLLKLYWLEMARHQRTRVNEDD
ncbi:MAG: glycosyltransferase [Lewinella sp.]|nr:glycosyltransferase [Lewinella sp.]